MNNVTFKIFYYTAATLLWIAAIPGVLLAGGPIALLCMLVDWKDEREIDVWWENIKRRNKAFRVKQAIEQAIRDNQFV